MIFHRIRMLVAACSVLVLTYSALPTSAENLHKKYRDLGNARWDCTWIHSGDSRRTACEKCEAAGKEFDDSGAGACVNRTQSLREETRRKFEEKYGPTKRYTTPDPLPPNRDRRYGALAYFKTTLPSGHNHAVASAGYGPTDLDAQGDAKSGCVARGGSNCSIVGTFSNGACGYIMLCVKGNNVSYGAGKTEAEARSKCLGGNFDRSANPNGGCTPRQ